MEGKQTNAPPRVQITESRTGDFRVGYVRSSKRPWLKAKGWPEAVVFIAFIPLTIFLIPFVRLLVVAAPQFMLAAMIMMPFILVVEVAVLPDNS